MESKKQMKADAIITVHLNSKRLPYKVLYPILNKPLLWHVLNRASYANTINRIIVTSPLSDDQQVIGDICHDISSKKEIYFVQQDDYNNGVKDLLRSVYRVAKNFDVENIIRITADCPLLDPIVIDYIVLQYFKQEYEYVSNIIEYSWPEGMDVEVLSLRLLEEANDNAVKDSEREHITRYIQLNKDIPKLNIKSKQKYTIFKGSVDNYNDYKFVKRIFEEINKDNFSADEIENLIRVKPELLDINKDSIINETALLLDRMEHESNKKHRDLE